MAIKFRAMGAAPALKRETYKINDSQRVESVALFLRKQLELGPATQLFLYVGLSFAPALDENVGNLWSVSGPLRRARAAADGRSASGAARSWRSTTRRRARLDEPGGAGLSAAHALQTNTRMGRRGALTRPQAADR